MLQDEIMKLGGYFRGIEYYNDALIVKVIFPTNWKVYPSSDESIKPASSDNSNGEYYYYGNVNSVSLDDIFSLINETIEANRDAELKIQLLTSKIKELQELFKVTPYEELLTLNFYTDKKEKKPKRKYTKKKKAESDEIVEAEPVNIDKEEKE